jgi:hypothetical protein
MLFRCRTHRLLGCRIYEVSKIFYFKDWTFYPSTRAHLPRNFLFLDKVAFEATGATMDQAQDEPIRILLRGRDFKVMKQFAFDWLRTTQSVTVENDEGTKLVFVKGSSESIERICDQLSVPASFRQTVRESARIRDVSDCYWISTVAP